MSSRPSPAESLPSELYARVVSTAIPPLTRWDIAALASTARVQRDGVDEAYSGLPWYARRSFFDPEARLEGLPGPAGFRIVGEEAIGAAVSSDGSRILLVLRSPGASGGGGGATARCVLLPGGPSIPMLPARFAAAWVDNRGAARVVAYDEGSNVFARIYRLDPGSATWIDAWPRGISLQAARSARGESSVAVSDRVLWIQGTGPNEGRILAEDGSIAVRGAPAGPRPLTVAFNADGSALFLGSGSSGAWILQGAGTAAVRVPGHARSAISAGSGWVLFDSRGIGPAHASLLRGPGAPPEPIGSIPRGVEPVACVAPSDPGGVVLGLSDGRLLRTGGAVEGRGTNLRVGWASACDAGVTVRYAYDPSIGATHLAILDAPEPFEHGRGPTRGEKRRFTGTG